MTEKKLGAKAVARIRPEYKATENLPKSYVEYKPYIPTKRNEKKNSTYKFG